MMCKMFLSKTSLPAVLWLVIACGCSGGNGPPLGRVDGQVTWNGQPLASALVCFSPVEGGRGSTGTTDENGYYRLEFSFDQKGALLGEHLVTIQSAEAPGEGAKDPLLPENYNSASQLKAVVKEGRNSINFPLTSNGSIPDRN